MHGTCAAYVATRNDCSLHGAQMVLLYPAQPFSKKTDPETPDKSPLAVSPGNPAGEPSEKRGLRAVGEAGGDSMAAATSSRNHHGFQLFCCFLLCRLCLVLLKLALGVWRFCAFEFVSCHAFVEFTSAAFAEPFDPWSAF